MLGLFKKKVISNETKNVVAVVDGKLIALKSVKDMVFSQKLIGDGFAIEPSNNTICAPVTGTINMIFPTGHAFGITTKDGIEILVHIGIDTVALNGNGFKKHVKKGDYVHAGETCVTVDFDLVKEAGYDITTMIVFTNNYNGNFEELDYNINVKKKDVIVIIDD